MKRLLSIGFSALTLAACATASTSGPASRPDAQVPPLVVRPAPVQPILIPPIVAPEPPLQCRAEQHQALVGRPRTEIPVPTDPSKQRVACTTCPVTQDYRPDRLNFFFDATTGIVKEVRCG